MNAPNLRQGAATTLAGICASLLWSVAGDDQGIPPADVLDFEKAMKGLGKDVDIKIYEGAAHAFMNPDDKKGYNEAAAKDAWARIDTLFTKNLAEEASLFFVVLPGGLKTISPPQV